ncbi:hypothetical protein Ocepr_1254 [Oceanithermus profundus DSM 14977]|uniref:Uncharacterized protein n=1 Tax=Oceanithermus profundus (strain DSM 14977 / NBRC 100410 / VKM B-2274 / 506) TaxID=670487 RepID=E4U8N1_OCEP5|nr:hypothetical protein [Oceanithermus profundus]ADR36711.1 hypothetical protein Ocepr_1254 [Oceanithermus profundus DSM 14977]
MKNQYFGDINDYRKYGLLRSVLAASRMSLYVAWMLTEDDGGTDGGRIDYLQDPDRWSRFDPELFETLRKAVAEEGRRDVEVLERSGLLSPARYFREPVPRRSDERERWFARLADGAGGADLVFLDPDVGVESKSASSGNHGSERYVFWHELRQLWDQNNSLLLYQHFPREERYAFTQRLLGEIEERLPEACPLAFSTSHVLFLLALQPRHVHHGCAVLQRLRRDWPGEFRVALYEGPAA